MRVPRCISAALFLVPFATSISAQEARSLADLTTAVPADQQVAVKDFAGDTTRGYLVDVSDAAITIRRRDAFGTEHTRRFERGTIERIERSDRLWNGALIGVAAGFAATEIWVYNLCGARDRNNECAAIASGVGWMTMVPGGAVIGALIDRGIGNQVIYRAAPTPPLMRLAPVVTPTAQGLYATLRF